MATEYAPYSSGEEQDEGDEGEFESEDEGEFESLSEMDIDLQSDGWEMDLMEISEIGNGGGGADEGQGEGEEGEFDLCPFWGSEPEFPEIGDFSVEEPEEGEEGESEEWASDEETDISENGDQESYTLEEYLYGVGVEGEGETEDSESDDEWEIPRSEDQEEELEEGDDEEEESEEGEAEGHKWGDCAVEGGSENSNGIESDRSTDPCCPVCFELWTPDGPHRVCCIPCGHLYGRSCLEKWVRRCKDNTAKCPICNRKFKGREIINLYAPSIAVRNDEELCNLRKQNELLQVELKDFKEARHVEMEEKMAGKISAVVKRQQNFEEEIDKRMRKVEEQMAELRSMLVKRRRT